MRRVILTRGRRGAARPWGATWGAAPFSDGAFLECFSAVFFCSAFLAVFFCSASRESCFSLLHSTLLGGGRALGRSVVLKKPQKESALKNKIHGILLDLRDIVDNCLLSFHVAEFSENFQKVCEKIEIVTVVGKRVGWLFAWKNDPLSQSNRNFGTKHGRKKIT